MRHRAQRKHFGRDGGHRKALFRNLVSSLVESERIVTTLAKAKELRRHVERAITIGKTGDLNATRVLLSKYPNKDTVSKLIKDLGVRFKDRPGGYTRILKLGARPGDGAESAIIEFVDFQLPEVAQEEKKEEVVKAKVAAKRKVAKKKAAKKKATTAAKKKSVAKKKSAGKKKSTAKKKTVAKKKTAKKKTSKK